MAAKISVQEHVSMRSYTTFRIGGEARCVAFPKNEKQLCHCMKLAEASPSAPIILGGGSNVLVKDCGIDELVIATRAMKFLTLDRDHDQVVCCDAGVSLRTLCLFARKNGLSGLEFAYGIPGSVGGAMFMNAGAYGGEMKDVVQSVHALQKNGEIREFSGEELLFSYRSSVFMKRLAVVLDAKLRLNRGNDFEISRKMEFFQQKRRETQPLDFPNAGSIFKRPEGHSAAELIDQCDLKGSRVGDAEVSTKHAGFIVNRGNATSADVQELLHTVQAIVKQKTGILLEPEIRFLP